MRTESTPGARGPVFCGVDTHADSHWLCVLDWRGRKVLSRQFLFLIAFIFRKSRDKSFGFHDDCFAS